ncbi:hypothetical protein V6Z12_A11G345800 [Gossypium hirsutum]
MGGIDKTTLARVAYTQMSPYFEGKSFLADVREVSNTCGLVSLQKQLLSQILSEECFNFFNVHEVNAIISHRLSNKKVLVVLDDVNNLQHLKCLVGRRDWFGLGIRIITTTLNDNDSLRLFSLKAFNSETRLENDFNELSKHVLEYAGGLPLALEVLGSFLCVFLDIGIDILIKKSLTVNEYNKLRMHDLLQQMERKNVREKSIDEPGKRWRLWVEKNATEMIEGMAIDNKRQMNKILILSADTFLKMKRLRLLIMGCLLRSLPSSFQPENVVILLLSYSNIEQLWRENIPLYKLKVLNLKGSKNPIKTSDFTTAPNLETLVLEGCTRLVYVHPSVRDLKRLKLLNIRGCKSLRSFPTKIGMESLEKLIFSGCSNLESFSEIDGKMECLLELHLDGMGIKGLPISIGNLSSLVLLNLKDCRNLYLRVSFTLGSAIFCWSLKKQTVVAQSTAEAEYVAAIGAVNQAIWLRKIMADLNQHQREATEINCHNQSAVAIAKNPVFHERTKHFKIKFHFVREIEQTQEVKLIHCSSEEQLADILTKPLSVPRFEDLRAKMGVCSMQAKEDIQNPTIGKCKSLKILNLSGCYKVEKLPENLQQVEFLEELDLSETSMRKQPPFSFQFKNLKVLSFNGSKGPSSMLQKNLPSLLNVIQRGRTNSMALMLPLLLGLSSLTRLNLKDCNLCEQPIRNAINLSCLSQVMIRIPNTRKYPIFAIHCCD